MPVEIRDSDGGLGNIIIGRGIVTEEEWVDALKKHLTQDKDKFRQYRYSLSDYTETTKLEVSTQKIKLIAEYGKRAAIGNPEAIVAVVANQDLIYGLTRMSKTLIGEIGWEIMIFRSREDAEAWIKKRAKEKYGNDGLTIA